LLFIVSLDIIFGSGLGQTQPCCRCEWYYRLLLVLSLTSGVGLQKAL